MEKTIKIIRKGIIHQIPLNPLSNRRYFGGGGSSSPEAVPKYTQGQMQLLDALTGIMTPQTGRGLTPYPGETVAGLSPLQERGFNIAGGMGGIGQTAQKYFQNMLGQVDTGQAGRGMGMAEGALGDVLTPFDPAEATQLWETAWKAPALKTWREDIMPSIMEKGISMSGTPDSGPMQRELARSGEDLATNLSAQLANLLYSGQQAQLGRQQTGVNQAMQLANLPSALLQGAGGVGQQGTNLLSQMLNVGTQQRSITQEQLTGEQQKWQQAQPYANPWLQYLPTALGASAFDTVVGQEGPSMASELAPYALAAAIAFCDIRLKDNFTRIENALDKVNQLEGLTYNFRGENDRSAGIIAQELEKVLPEGVVEHKGIKFVRIDAIIGLLVNAINELNQKMRSN